MQRAHKICVLISAVLATFALAGDAAAKEKRQGAQPTDSSNKKDISKSQPGEVMAARLSAVATVDKVDAKKRKLTLKDEQGRSMTLDVPENVSNLSSIKKGDKVMVDYFAAVGLQLKPKGTSSKNQATMGAERTAAPLPGGLVARKVTATVEIRDIDTSNNLLTIKGPQGNEVILHITDPEMQSNLGSLKKGDKLQITYADAIAINVTPQGAQSSSPNSSDSSKQGNGGY